MTGTKVTIPSEAVRGTTVQTPRLKAPEGASHGDVKRVKARDSVQHGSTLEMIRPVLEPEGVFRGVHLIGTKLCWSPFTSVHFLPD